MAEKVDPNFGENTANVQSADEPDDRVYMTRAELEQLLAERDQKHAEELAAVRQQLPVALVPANAGGPGIDNHQPSWNLAEQQAAARGEVLDHWI